jgi:hypothetical protein
MLTAFFTANHLYPFACQYTYQEFPQHFIWHRLNKNWCPQLNGFAIGQLCFVAPTAEEHFYLHMLLITIKGLMSWQDLRTFDNVVHPLFYAACLVWGLLQNDDEWQQCLTEVAGICTGDALHHLFALVVRHCEPVQPQTLWNEFQANLCNDLHHCLHWADILNLSDDDMHDYGLFFLNKHLSNLSTSLSNFSNMPQILNDWDRVDENPFISKQLAYN